MDWFFITAVILAYIVKGMCGFANTLVFSTILSFRINNINISPLELIIGYPSNVIITYKERKSVDPKIWLPLSLLVIIGSIPGILFLKTGDSGTIKVVFGLVVTFIGVEMFFRESRKNKRKSSKVTLVIIGIASGIVCGLFGIGAFLAAYISRTTENNHSFRGNLCVVFLIENTFRIIVYSITGIINSEIFTAALYLIPFMAIGLLFGMGLSRICNEKTVKRIVIVMLILSGLSLILNNMKSLIMLSFF